MTEELCLLDGWIDIRSDCGSSGWYAVIHSTALRPDRSAQCASPGVCTCEAYRCSAATVANDSACLYESLVLYIYSSQPSCVLLDATPLCPTSDRHEVAHTHPPSQQGHSKLGHGDSARCGMALICYHYSQYSLQLRHSIPECNSLSQR